MLSYLRRVFFINDCQLSMVALSVNYLDSNLLQFCDGFQRIILCSFILVFKGIFGDYCYFDSRVSAL